MRVWVALVGVGVLLLGAAPSASAAKLDPRYRLVHGCYALQSAASGKFVAKAGGGGYAAATGARETAEPFRMQATRLGHYLFFGKASDFMSTDAGGRVVTAAAPSEAGDWRVETRGGGFHVFLPAAGRSLAVDDAGALVLSQTASAFRFVRTDGCATFPESEVNVTGRPLKGAAPWAETRGFLDPHFHWMAFEFLGGGAHCGRPWHPYGIALALVDCPDHQPDGSGAVLENVLSNGTPFGRHDVHGWPSFIGWPRPESLTHEGSYHRWVERAWRGGLRLATVLLVDNAVLCEVYPIKRNSCDEMASIRLQAKDMRDLENYIDAQSGGPGKGWMRIVTDPFEARRVINQGKLAVILGIESSRLFHCRELNGDAECDVNSIDSGLEEMYGLGVRQMEIVNKFDNALTGVAGDDGVTGLVVNNGNKIETGHYWRMKTCQGLPDHVHDRTQPTAPSQVAEDPVFQSVVSNYLPTGETPIYPPGPHCNEAGLTPLGKHLIERMMAKGMIFDPDHMSVKARLQALDILEANRYSGVISSHSWSTPDAYPRIYALGGVVTPISGRTEGFVQEWRTLKPQAAPKYFWGFGFGSDQNGLHAQPPARKPANPVTYPFKSFDGGSTIDRVRTGTRTWDVNTDGASHYGLFPDWIEDLRKVAGDEIVDDMARGPEAYLQMWERAIGVPADRCIAGSGSFGDRGLGGIRLGATIRTTLMRAGQPKARDAGALRYCADGAVAAPVAAGLSGNGRIRLVGSTHAGHRAGGVAPGDARAGRGLEVRRASRRTAFVHGVRAGRVRFVAVTSRSLASRRAKLRAALRAAGLR